MSLIENALKKLQGERAAQESAPRQPSQPAAQETRRAKVEPSGPQHHIDRSALQACGLLPAVHQESTLADEFRRIKRPLITNAFRQGGPREKHSNVIMVTSPLPGAGKTFFSLNLAISLSLEREINVVLVDADIPKPRLTRELGLQSSPGLTELLVEDGVAVSEILVRTDLNDIQVLPAGKRHEQATELLASDRMSRLVDELSARSADRIVVVDSPPLLITSEAPALAHQMGQITLVVEAGATTQQQLTQALEHLRSETAVNLVLNKTRTWGWAPGGEYSGGYAYGYGNEPG